MEVWRDDNFNPHEQPTSFMVVPCARDMIPTDNVGFSLGILHVKTIRGKGFMPCITVKQKVPFRSLSASGQVSLGTDENAYAAALQEGNSMLEAERARARRPITKRPSTN